MEKWKNEFIFTEKCVYLWKNLMLRFFVTIFCNYGKISVLRKKMFKTLAPEHFNNEHGHKYFCYQRFCRENVCN